MCLLSRRQLSEPDKGRVRIVYLTKLTFMPYVSVSPAKSSQRPSSDPRTEAQVLGPKSAQFSRSLATILHIIPRPNRFSAHNIY